MSPLSSDIVEEKTEEEEEKELSIKKPIPKLDMLLKRGRYYESL
jgi:hypothetical protein